MAKTQQDLQFLLEDLMGKKATLQDKQNVYFQPPESFKMNYPCIRYKLADIVNRNADNLSYNQAVAYELTYISKKPNGEMQLEIAKLPMCKFDRFYTADNLNHYVYTIYF